MKGRWANSSLHKKRLVPGLTSMVCGVNKGKDQKKRGRGSFDGKWGPESVGTLVDPVGEDCDFKGSASSGMVRGVKRGWLRARML